MRWLLIYLGNHPKASASTVTPEGQAFIKHYGEAFGDPPQHTAQRLQNALQALINWGCVRVIFKPGEKTKRFILTPRGRSRLRDILNDDGT